MQLTAPRLALLSASLVLIFQSCGVRRDLVYGSYRPTGSPSVTLKSGETIQDEKVRMREPIIGRDKVQVGDQSFLAKDVQSYQTSTARYMNVGKANFGKQLAGGPLNVYRYSYVYTVTTGAGGGAGMSTSTREANVDYVQKGDNESVVLLTPKNLRPLVADYRPSAELLEREARLRRTQRLIGYGCLAGMAAGVEMIFAGASAGDDGSGSGVAAAGVGLVLVSGITTFVKSGVMRIKRAKATQDAVTTYNRRKR